MDHDADGTAKESRNHAQDAPTLPPRDSVTVERERLAHSPWNSLEVTKLIVTALTPALIFIFGLRVNQSVRDSERADRVAEEARAQADNRRLAVQNLSRFIYERRARAELVASSLRRNASIEELTRRKEAYDEAYVSWNSNHQANLLLIRQLLGNEEYTDFERLMEFQLVSRIFNPLDNCLTRAYDARLRKENPVPILDTCLTGDAETSARTLVQAALDCGYAFTDELFRLSASPGNPDRQDVGTREIEERCAIPVQPRKRP
jgi:hypothetical protein